MNKKVITTFVVVVIMILILLCLTACPALKYLNEQAQIEKTIKTEYELVAAPKYVRSTISFTNVLDRDATIKITRTFNNGVYLTDTVTVKAGEEFSKGYLDGYNSQATFKIEILSLS